jgi:hypothetical protein
MQKFTFFTLASEGEMAELITYLIGGTKVLKGHAPYRDSKTPFKGSMTKAIIRNPEIVAAPMPSIHPNIQKVITYVKRKKGGATLKQVQSRFDKFRGVTCKNYAYLLTLGGAKLNTGNKFTSKWTVKA